MAPRRTSCWLSSSGRRRPRRARSGCRWGACCTFSLCSSHPFWSAAPAEAVPAEALQNAGCWQADRRQPGGQCAAAGRGPALSLVSRVPPRADAPRRLLLARSAPTGRAGVDRGDAGARRALSCALCHRHRHTLRPLVCGQGQGAAAPRRACCAVRAAGPSGGQREGAPGVARQPDGDSTLHVGPEHLGAWPGPL